MFSRRHWIPPGALFAGQIAHGLSWVLLAWIAVRGAIDAVTLPALAWIHVVALGWFTLVALAVLFQVIPGFTDVRWRGETIARWSLAGLGAGVAFFVAALLWRPVSIEAAAGLVFVSLGVYIATAFATLSQAANVERTERAIARAFAITLAVLLLTALAGLALASLLAGRTLPAWIAALPAVHAHLGIFGWLSLLVFGISARTVRVITGDRSRFPVIHIIVGSCALLGTFLLAIGLGIQATAVTWIGGAVFALAALAYAFDVLDALRRASVPHRPPQAFMLAAISWLVVSLVLGAGVLLGQSWQLAYGFALLIGWIGQMVNAHIYHIGVRLIATMYRGDEDETQPQVLLTPMLSWASFVLFQAAVVFGIAGLAQPNRSAVAASACCGLVGWLSAIANLVSARRRAVAGRAVVTAR
ncbi:MAG: hypothetical protein ACXWNK_05875 [Vulcanimicrobiaceae bacterium]